MRSLVVLAMVSGTVHAAPCKDGDPFAKAVLHDDVAFLAAKALDGRAPGTDGDAKARAFIAERFACLGLAAAGDGGGYEQAFKSGAASTANVIAKIEGTSDDIVMISAHHDHLGKGHLGANDDGSGVAALLAIAKAAAQGERPTRTLVFAAFGAEEDGMIGSGFFAKHPTIELARVVQFVELDMVGSHDSADLVAAMGAFKGFAARTLLDKHLKEFPKIHVSAGGRARGSDFEPFCKLGVPYAFFWTPDHRCYHATCDTVDRLDLRHMIDIAKLASALVHDLADTTLDLAKLRAKRGCGV
ncbi:MAG TPA: M20/M25/M40 family metallo-hydrolase [Kofleriaceae bacterium]